MTFIAISLCDFHANQKKGTAGTVVRMKFIAAKNIEAAKKHALTFYDGPWSIINKKVIDKHIVCN